MTPDLPAVEVAILHETNSFRYQKGLGGLKRNDLLDRAARKFARYLAQSGKFSHTADGRKPAQRIAATGYKYCQVAENLARHSRSVGFAAQELAKLAVNGWKNSPGHRRNMMQANVTEIGVGVAKTSGQHRYLSVQLFGRPQSLRYTFEIRNESRQRIKYTFSKRQSDIPGRTSIKMTVCVPGILKFQQSARRRDGQNRPPHFKTGSGDQFVISVQNSTLFVLHRRHANQMD